MAHENDNEHVKSQATGATTVDAKASLGDWLVQQYGAQPQAEHDRQADAERHARYEAARENRENIHTKYADILGPLEANLQQRATVEEGVDRQTVVIPIDSKLDRAAIADRLNQRLEDQGITGAHVSSLAYFGGTELRVDAAVMRAHPEIAGMIKTEIHGQGPQLAAAQQAEHPAATAPETHAAAAATAPEAPVPAPKPHESVTSIAEAHPNEIGKREHFHDVPESVKATVRTAQQQMADLGIRIQPEGKHYGPKGDGVDGNLGASTEMGILQFQRDNGLEQTGRINDEFMKKLDEVHKTHAQGHAQAAPEHAAQVHGNPDLHVAVDPKVRDDMLAIVEGMKGAAQDIHAQRMAAQHATAPAHAAEQDGPERAEHAQAAQLRPDAPPVIVDPKAQAALREAITGLRGGGVAVKEEHDGPATNGRSAVASKAVSMDMG